VWVGINNSSGGGKGNRRVLLLSIVHSGQVCSKKERRRGVTLLTWYPTFNHCWLAHGHCFSYEKRRGGMRVMLIHLDIVHVLSSFMHC